MCVSRWTLHADAVDDGAFPQEALDAFPDQLFLPNAIGAAEIFRLEGMGPQIMHAAADEAEQRLRLALDGDTSALATYLAALGECSTKPKMVRDYGVGAIEVTEEGLAS